MYSKTVPARNPHLLAMARGRECMVRLSRCLGAGETTVSAHSNFLRHGKGKARKADDQFTVWACANCHSWLDQGAGTAFAKEQAFEKAMVRQEREWERISTDPLAKAKDRAAAQWALDQLQSAKALELKREAAYV